MVCFDITDNRIRYRAVKILKNYGIRVQKSVFECPNLSEASFLKMRSQLADVIDADEDSVRYYALCKDCADRIRLDGLGRLHKPKRYRVV
jgi:CRISPR-associated protein Cas2